MQTSTQIFLAITVRQYLIITGEEYRPDMLLLTKENTLYVAELTVGHESNLENNSIRKKQKYSKLVKELKDLQITKGTTNQLLLSIFQ